MSPIIHVLAPKGSEVMHVLRNVSTVLSLIIISLLYSRIIVFHYVSIGLGIVSLIIFQFH